MIKKLLLKILRKYQSILFVGSTDILPEPLSKEEEKVCILKKMEGDNNARNKLIEHNLRLVAHIAKKYESKYPLTSLAGMSHAEIEAFKRGSSATLLLLETTPSGPRRIHAKAVGDTCLFVLDGEGRVVYSFPLTAQEQFSTSAYLVTVTFEGLRQLFDEQTKGFYWKEFEIDLTDKPDALLLCATDAVSQWIVARRDRPGEINRLIKAVKRPTKEKFVRFIERERRLGTMPTDDSTVAILRP